MTRLIRDDESVFDRWQGHYAGRFLVSDSDHPTKPLVDTELLIVQAFTLSTGEQVLAGCWWNLVMQSAAPWVDEPFTKLTHLDPPSLAALLRLTASLPRRLFAVEPDRLEGL